MTTTRTTGTWVIARDDAAPNGGTNTVYWCCDDDPDIWPAPECWKGFGPSDASGTIRAWPTKWEAVITFRENGNKMTRSHRAVKLTAEQAASLLPAVPAATNEPQIRVGVTTDAATAKTAGIDLHYTGLDTPEHARDVDRQLRQQARHFDSSWLDLEALIAEAKNWQIHIKLGFTSWPDYIADVARREMPNVARSVEQRRQVVALLAGEGMSQRAIADAVGVSNATISRDQEVLHDVTPTAPTDFADSAPVTTPDTVTGRDGKQYPAKPKREPKPKPKPDVPKPEPWEPPTPERQELEFGPELIAKQPWLAPRSEWLAPELEPKPEPAPKKKLSRETPGEEAIRYVTQTIVPAIDALPPWLARVGMDKITPAEAQVLREELVKAIRLCELALERMGGAE
jgi:hypothetical protein